MKIGYVIANDNEEFLVFDQTTRHSSSRAWSVLPDLAQLFPSRRLAEKSAKLLDVENPLWVLQLIETPDNYLIRSESKDRPSWL